MTTTNPSNSARHNITIHNTNERHHTLIAINIAAQAPLKLTANNYVPWKLQFHSLFSGYDLLGYIDGSKPSPPTHITQNDTTIPNPEYTVWCAQDRLILNALIGSLSPTIIPSIAHAETSQEAWTILANTYAKPTRGLIKQVKSHLKNPTKGSQSITEFLQTVKARADAILGAPMDDDDLTEKILDVFGDDFKELVRAVQACDNPISFEELHDKLLNFEAFIQGMKSKPAHFPASPNPANRNNTGWRWSHTSGNNNNWRPLSNHNNNNTGWRPLPNSVNRFPAPTNTGPNNYHSDRLPPRLYLGHCQICGILGHTAKKCPSFQIVPVPSSTTITSSISSPQTPWQPRAHCAMQFNYLNSSLNSSGCEEGFGSMSLPSGTFTPENSSLFSDDNSNQTKEISQIGEQNVVKETVGLDLGKSSNKKQKKLRSDVWDNFEKHTDENGKEWAICNICKVKKDGSSKQGTTHLRNHFNSCSKNKSNKGGGSASGDKPAENSVIGGYNHSMSSRFPMQPQNVNVNAPTRLVSASPQVHLPRSDNLLALGPSQSSSLGFQSLGTSNRNTYRGFVDFSPSEGEIRMRSHEMLENDDIHIFNVGGQGQGQGSFNATEDNSNQTQEISWIGEQNVVKETVGLDLDKSGYNDSMSSRFPMQPQNVNVNASTPLVSASQQVHLPRSHNLLAIGPSQSSSSGFQSLGTSNPKTYRGVEDFFSWEDGIRMRSHEMLENYDMQHLLRLFNMGGQGQGQGSFNATEDGYPYTSPFMSNPSPNYSLDDEPSRSSGKAVVAWMKIKVAMRWGFFIRKKAAERRAQLVELDES